MPNKSMYLGEATEKYIVSLLLKEEREVYLPVVDDHGVDILVMSKQKHQRKKQVFKYQELQVKSLSDKGLFAGIKCPKPAPNYWFVFYVRQYDTIWLVNSVDFVKIASRNKIGDNIGKYSLELATKKGFKESTSKYIVKDFSRLP